MTRSIHSWLKVKFFYELNCTYKTRANFVFLVQKISFSNANTTGFHSNFMVKPFKNHENSIENNSILKLHDSAKISIV